MRAPDKVGIEDKSEIIFLFSQWKHMLFSLIKSILAVRLGVTFLVQFCKAKESLRYIPSVVVGVCVSVSVSGSVSGTCSVSVLVGTHD